MKNKIILTHKELMTLCKRFPKLTLGEAIPMLLEENAVPFVRRLLKGDKK